jgi:meiotic recombination protein DMC1
MYARAHNSEHQLELLNELCVHLCEDKTYRLVVVDSIMALFRTDYSGRGELAERQQKLGAVVKFLFKYLLILTNFIDASKTNQNR